MACLHVNYHSEVLGMATSMDVILPEQTQGQIGQDNIARPGPARVLYLLHGLSDDHTIWQRRTSIERYVVPLGIAVVMPTTHRGFYTDQVDGYDYFTHIADEVPAKAEAFFNISNKREDRSVAGLSMGGYGAFKIALSQPRRWCAAASLSGATDLVGNWLRKGEPTPEKLRTYGDVEAVEGSNNDIHHLLKTVAASAGPKPRLFQCCGTEDFLYEGNLATRKLASGLDLDYVYQEGPGAHEWSFWDDWIQRVLAWMDFG